jgi:uncharacterized protein with gpF-like domain
MQNTKKGYMASANVDVTQGVGSSLRHETRREKEMVELRTKGRTEETRSSLTNPRYMITLETGQRAQLGAIPAVQGSMSEHRVTVLGQIVERRKGTGGRK